jgi:hypothetical protein
MEYVVQPTIGKASQVVTLTIYTVFPGRSLVMVSGTPSWKLRLIASPKQPTRKASPAAATSTSQIERCACGMEWDSGSRVLCLVSSVETVRVLC